MNNKQHRLDTGLDSSRIDGMPPLFSGLPVDTLWIDEAVRVLESKGRQLK
jgi:hypothetical protein